MKHSIFGLILTLAAALPAAGADADVAKEILALERSAMDAWMNGNPDRALELSDPDITFFHGVTEKRLGYAEYKALCEGYRGKPLYQGYEMVDPKVQVAGDIAILTYQLITRDDPRRWNGTQVYRRGKNGWRVLHTHWSLTGKIQ